MKPDILSRCADRSGIDRDTGRERLVVEIDWAFYTNKEILDSFNEWLKADRPRDIGRRSDKGRNKVASWLRKLDNLAVMRLLHHATLAEMRDKFPEAWKRYGPKPPSETENAKDKDSRQ
jgi:hypothetical protein